MQMTWHPPGCAGRYRTQDLEGPVKDLGRKPAYIADFAPRSLNEPLRQDQTGVLIICKPFLFRSANPQTGHICRDHDWSV
jgi:hypothetical protein